MTSNTTRCNSDKSINDTLDIGVKAGSALPVTSKLLSSRPGSRSGSQIDEETTLDKTSSSKSGTRSSKSKSPKRPSKTTSRPKIDLVLRERVRKSSSGSLRVARTNSSSRHSRSSIHQPEHFSSHSRLSNAQWKSTADQNIKRPSSSGALLLSLYGNINHPKSDGKQNNACWGAATGAPAISRHSTGSESLSKTSAEAVAKSSMRRSLSPAPNGANPPLRRTLSTTEARSAGMLPLRRTLSTTGAKQSIVGKRWDEGEQRWDQNQEQRNSRRRY